jgi:hypothetical protein
MGVLLVWLARGRFVMDFVLDANGSDREKAQLAETLIGAGRGAIVMAMFGAGWLGWGLGTVKAFNGLTGPLFGCTEMVLLGCSLALLRSGRALAKRYPLPPRERRPVLRAFLVVLAAEVGAILLASILARRLGRPDLLADWCALVVGIHFFPLARIFRTPQLTVLGVALTLWSVVCWALFHGNALTIAVSVGTGTLFGVRCVASLVRASGIRRRLLDFGS